MRYCHLLVATLIILGATARPAHAILPFYNVFKTEYVEKHPDKRFAEEVGKASNRCFVCHQGTKSKKHHNEFGKLLVPLLDKKEDLKNVDKISAEIKKVFAMHVDPKDDKSETYLDRWKAGKWPGGKLEDLKKEPKNGEEEKEEESEEK